MPKLLNITINPDGTYTFDFSGVSPQIIGIWQRKFPQYPVQIADPTDTIDDPNNPGTQIPNPNTRMIANPVPIYIWYIDEIVIPKLTQDLTDEYNAEVSEAAMNQASLNNPFGN